MPFCLTTGSDCVAPRSTDWNLRNHDKNKEFSLRCGDHGKPLGGKFLLLTLRGLRILVVEILMWGQAPTSESGRGHLPLWSLLRKLCPLALTGERGRSLPASVGEERKEAPHTVRGAGASPEHPTIKMKSLIRHRTEGCSRGLAEAWGWWRSQILSFYFISDGWLIGTILWHRLRNSFLLSSFTDIRFTPYEEPAPQSPHEKLAVLVHACSLRVGEAETGGFLGLLGQPTQLNWLVISRPTRLCLKIQSGVLLRNDSWSLSPGLHTCTHVPIHIYVHTNSPPNTGRCLAPAIQTLDCLLSPVLGSSEEESLHTPYKQHWYTRLVSHEVN